jgi:hypothetical protein
MLVRLPEFLFAHMFLYGELRPIDAIEKNEQGL